MRIPRCTACRRATESSWLHACSLPAEQRTIPLSEISARTKLGADGVEFLLMKTLSLKLIEGVIDQVDSTVQVSCTAVRPAS